MDEYPVLPYKLAIYDDLPSPILRGLNLNQIPVDRTTVSVIAILISVARGEVDRACDLFIKQDIVHGKRDVRITAKGELAKIACPLIGIEHSFQCFRIVCIRVDDLSIFHRE